MNSRTENSLTRFLPVDFLNTSLFSAIVVFSFLSFNSYPLLSLEALALWGCFFLVLGTVALICRLIRIPWAYSATLIILFLEISLNILFQMRLEVIALAGHVFLARLCLLLYILLVCAACFLARNHISKIIAAGLTVFLISGIVTSVTAPNSVWQIQISSIKPTTLKPNILFFILDEHTGFEGFPSAHKESREFEEYLKHAYLSLGFRVYGKAYSNYFRTSFAVRNLINGNTSGVESATVEKNTLLEKLYQEGYAIHVYENTYLDYCGSSGFKFAKCVKYRENSVAYLQDVPFSLRQRLWVLSHSCIAAQKSYYLKARFNRACSWLNIPNRDRVVGLSFLRVLEELKKDVETNKQGTVFFVHLLMPHSPYIFGENCQVKDVRAWESRRIKAPSERMTIYGHYMGQVKCLHRRLIGLFREWQDTGLFESMSVILAGDHGSRIGIFSEPLATNIQKVPQEDIVNAFSAFLVIKNGGYSNQLPVNEGHYIAEQIASPRALREFFPFIPPATKPEMIRLLDPETGTLKEFKMPPFGRSNSAR